MTERFDAEDRDWPLRPWIMAAIGAVGGLVIHLLTDNMTYATPFPVWKQAATTFTAIAVLSFLLTVELRRWSWSLAFALGWGAVLALVGWFTAQYNRNGEIMEFPFLSGILAVLIAAPLFQTIRDEGAWRFPYARLHRHAWTDAVIGAASLAFTGITFLLAWLIASLFDVIGIDAIKELLQEDWFGWMLAGLAFGGAIGILRERDALVATLQKLVMVVFSVLAPVLAVSLAAFLLSLPFTGLKGLWESDIPATPMLLLAGAGAILLANAVIGNGRDDRSPNIWLRRAALLLVVCVLPLAFFAALSMGQRVGQYGWTPERIWGVIAVGIAIAYGAVGWWSVYKGRQDFDDALRPLQTAMAIGLCGLALFLALPILDFGAISARSQLARLDSGQVKPEEFDWTAMAFDFGPSGRAALQDLAASRSKIRADAAKSALAATTRYELSATQGRLPVAPIAERLRVIPAEKTLPAAALQRISGTYMCARGACVAVWLDENRIGVLGQEKPGDDINFDFVSLNANGQWVQGDRAPVAGTPSKEVDLSKAAIQVETVQRRHITVDGVPESGTFE